MTSTPRPDDRPTGASVGRHPADLAPSVARDWAEAFVLEQRLLGVPGPRIGDALLTVESHVTESGQSAVDAFGDPVGYARDLAAGRSGGEPEVTATGVLSSVLGLVGLLVATTAFGPWLGGEPATLTLGLAVLAGLVLVGLGAFLARPTAVLRLLVDRLWVLALGFAGVFAVGVVLLLALPQVLLELPAGWTSLVGVALVLVGAVLAYLDGSGDDDLVLAPGEQAPAGTTSRLLGSLVLPGATALMLGLSWVLHQLG